MAGFRAPNPLSPIVVDTFNLGTPMPNRVGEVLSIRLTRTSRMRAAPGSGPPVSLFR